MPSLLRQVCHYDLHALSDSLIAINGVFKDKYSFLFYVDFPSVLTNFR